MACHHFNFIWLNSLKLYKSNIFTIKRFYCNQVSCLAFNRHCHSKKITSYRLTYPFVRDFSNRSELNSLEINSSPSTERNVDQTRLLKVAIIGLPNAGKSTVINGLVGRRVCSISSKVHTTRSRIRAMKMQGKTQLIFLDTPGLVNATEVKKYNLEQSFLHDTDLSLKQADTIGVVHDVANHWTRDRLDLKTLRLLHFNANKPSFLVLNKIDVLKSKRKLLDLVRILTNGSLASVETCLEPQMSLSELELKRQARSHAGWSHFSDVFMISALTGSGIEELKNHLLQKAYPSEWKFHPSKFTDQSPEDVILHTVRACLLEHLPQEIPYNLSTTLEYFGIAPEGTITTVVLVGCPTPRLEKLLVGSKGKRIKFIACEAEQELRNTFQETVRLRLVVTGKF